MPSKAQGLSLNTVIIGAIVLIVLLILVGLLTGFFGNWKPKFKGLTETSCAAKGGVAKVQCSGTGEREEGSFFEDVKEGEKCCVTCGQSENQLCCRTATPCNTGLKCQSDRCVKA